MSVFPGVLSYGSHLGQGNKGTEETVAMQGKAETLQSTCIFCGPNRTALAANQTPQRARRLTPQ